MPIFDIYCNSCEEVYEVLQSRNYFNSDNMCECPKCKTLTAIKKPGVFSAHYKGTGFYTTDYKNVGKDKKEVK